MKRYLCSTCGRVESALIVPIGWTLFDGRYFCDDHRLTLHVFTPPGQPPAAPSFVDLPQIPHIHLLRKAA